MQIKRLLVVGYGSIGQRHLRIARSLLPDAEILVLRHKVYGTIPDFADGCLNTIQEAIAFDPQAAVIANPSTLHMPAALPLAERGVHLLIEKPLANMSSSVHDLLGIGKRQDVVLLTGYNLRFSPSLQRFRSEVQSGRIDKIISVRCEIGQYLPSWRPDSDYRKGVSASRVLGGGVLLELSHEIDYLRWIFGEIVAVNAVLAHQSSLEIDVEDTAHLVLKFSTKANTNALVANLNMDFVRHDTTRFCMAIGESGSIRWNALTGEVDYFAQGSSNWKTLFAHVPQRDESYIAEWSHFIDCVQNGTKPLITGGDGLAVLKIIEAARASSSQAGVETQVGAST